MARKKTVTVSSGKEIVVKSLPLSKQRMFIGVIADLISLLGSVGSDDAASAMKYAAQFIEERYDKIVELITASLLDESDEDEIGGLDDVVEVLIAIFEVNGGQNLMNRLGANMERLATGLEGMTQQISPKETQEAPRQIKPEV